jgi:hypothetical protein
MAQSRTRTRSSRASNRNTIARPRRSPENLQQAIRTFREAGARVMSALFFGAAEDAIDNLGATLQPAADRRPTTRPTQVAIEQVRLPTAQRPRGRPRKARGTTRTNAAGLNLANLGNGTTLADQVYRALPGVGGQTTISEIARQCRTSRGTQPNNQAIGGVLNRFQKAQIVNRNGEIVTTQRLARAA